MGDLIIRIPWMKHYKGPSLADTPTKDASTLTPSSWGAYAYNWLPFQGVMLGCFDNDVNDRSEIEIEKLGAPKGADLVYGVCIYWVSYSAQEGKTVLVGWHKDATVYRYLQPEPGDTRRKLPNGQYCGYYTKAEAQD